MNISQSSNISLGDTILETNPSNIYLSKYDLNNTSATSLEITCSNIIINGNQGNTGDVLTCNGDTMVWSPNLSGLTGPDGSTGADGKTGPTGPNGLTTYTGKSYRDITTISFLQNNGDVFYKASLSSHCPYLPNGTNILSYNELSTLLNVPDISITYISIIYSVHNISTGDVSFGIVDLSGNILTSTTMVAPVGSDINTNPSIVEYNLPISITTTIPRPLCIAIWGTNTSAISGSKYLNVRTVVVGYN